MIWGFVPELAICPRILFLVLGGGRELQVPGNHRITRRSNGKSRDAVLLSDDIGQAWDFQSLSLMVHLAYDGALGCKFRKIHASSSISLRLFFFFFFFTRTGLDVDLWP